MTSPVTCCVSGIQDHIYGQLKQGDLVGRVKRSTTRGYGAAVGYATLHPPYSVVQYRPPSLNGPK